MLKLVFQLKAVRVSTADSLLAVGPAQLLAFAGASPRDQFLIELIKFSHLDTCQIFESGFTFL